MAVDRTATARAIHELLRAVGYDPDHDAELRDTPTRVAEAFARDLLSGRDVDLEALVEQGAMPRQERCVVPRSSAPTGLFSFPSSRKTALA